METGDQHQHRSRPVSFRLPLNFQGLFYALDRETDWALSRWMAENAPRLEAVLLRQGVSRAYS